MTNIQIKDFQIGKEPKGVPLWAIAWAWIISLPFRIAMFLFPNKHDYMEVSDDQWTDWITYKDNVIKRKIVAETGFDGVIKFYHLQSNDQDLNKLLDKKHFGTFYKESIYGLYLREFNDPDDWPISYLSIIDNEYLYIRRLKKINSSWTDWRLESIDATSFNIVTHPADSYTKGWKITTSSE